MLKILKYGFKILTVIVIVIIIALVGLARFFNGCSKSSLFFTYGYNIRDGKVYYKQPFPDPVLELKTADVATFKVISGQMDSSYADNTYFATDKNSVYYRGWVVAGSDGPSLHIFNVNFAKDKNQCYYRGSLIPDADPGTFVIKEEDFSADKNHIFKRQVTVDHDASRFESFPNSNVVHTTNAVSIYDDIVPVPVGVTFKYLAYNYFALDNQVYLHNDPLPESDAKTFVAIDNFFSRSAHHVYYGDKIITGADPVSFHLLDAPYSRDDHHVFFFEKTIEGADVKTFEILNKNFQCARDRNAAYHEDKKITNTTASDLANKNLCTNCSDSAIYFAK